VPDEFVAALEAGELRPGEMKWVAVKGERLVFVNVEGRFYALADQCGHQKVPLSRGTLDGHFLECPLHFARYDVRTGKLVDGPLAEDVPVYEIRLEGDRVFVKV
jgi:3-phenylpropionate/trans-cinnamate dioxygenase ferredoxin component